MLFSNSYCELEKRSYEKTLAKKYKINPLGVINKLCQVINFQS